MMTSSIIKCVPSQAQQTTGTVPLHPLPGSLSFSASTGTVTVPLPVARRVYSRATNSNEALPEVSYTYVCTRRPPPALLDDVEP